MNATDAVTSLGKGQYELIAAALQAINPDEQKDADDARMLAELFTDLARSAVDS